ncbi:hypothetical protein [Kineococcus arenarius]|uniref:hypothetical protein n=1 Tax=unclassified Kineococcus TaxID=2621656 RepID=UPI003D7CF7FD
MTALVIVASLLMAGPSVVSALSGTGSVDTALLHLVLALLVSSIAARAVRSLVLRYQDSVEAAADAALATEGEAEHPARRREDA